MSSHESSMPFRTGLRWTLGAFAATVTCVGAGIGLSALSEQDNGEATTSDVRTSDRHQVPPAQETPTITSAEPMDPDAATHGDGEDNKVPLGVVLMIASLGTACIHMAARYNLNLQHGGPSEAEHAPVDQEVYNEEFEKIRRQFDKD